VARLGPRCRGGRAGLGLGEAEARPGVTVKKTGLTRGAGASASRASDALRGPRALERRAGEWSKAGARGWAGGKEKRNGPSWARVSAGREGRGRTGLPGRVRGKEGETGLGRQGFGLGSSIWVCFFFSISFLSNFTQTIGIQIKFEFKPYALNQIKF